MERYPQPMSFYGPGIRVVVSVVGGRCLLEVGINQAIYPTEDAVRLDVLFQPRDDRELPRGSPAVVYRSILTLTGRPGQHQAHTFTWLPRSITWDLAGRCHYRVTPFRMDGLTDLTNQIASDSSEDCHDGYNQ